MSLPEVAHYGLTHVLHAYKFPLIIINLQMRILLDRMRSAFREFYSGQQIFITRQEGQLKLSLTIPSSPDVPILSLDIIFNLLHDYFAQDNEPQCKLAKDLVQRKVQFHSLCANLVDQYQSFLTFALYVAQGCTSASLVSRIESLQCALSRLKSKVKHYFEVLELSLKTYVEDELEEFLKEFNVPVISKISLEKFVLNISGLLQHIPGSGWKIAGLQGVSQSKAARLLHHIEALDLSIFHYTQVAAGFSVVSTRSAFHRGIEKPVIDQILDLNLFQLLILLYRRKGLLIDFCQELSECLETLPSTLCSFVVYDKQDLSLEQTVQAQIHHQLKMFLELMKLLRSSSFNIFNYKNSLFSVAVQEICCQYSSNTYFHELLKILVQMTSFSNDLLRCGSNCAQVLQKMQVDFAGCDFASIRLSDISLSQANFLGANLQRSQLSNVDITGADFQLCNLNYVYWSAVECCQTPLADPHKYRYANQKIRITEDCKFIYQLSTTKVQYWERLRGKKVNAYTVRCGSKLDFAISQSGLLIAISNKWTPDIRLCLARNGRLVRKLCSTHLLLQDLSFSSDNRLLVAKGNSGGTDEIFIWDLRTSALIFRKESEQNNPSVFVKFVPNSHCLNYVLHKGAFKIFSLGGSPLEISEGLMIPDSIVLMTISKGQRKLAYLAENDLVSVWRVDSWKRQLTLPHKQKEVVYLEFTLDSSKLLIARQELIQTFSVLNGDLLWHLNFLQSNASISYSQELNLMVGVSYHHQFSIWDFEKLENRQRASDNLFSTNTLCFSQNSQFLISGGQDSVLRYIDVSNGKVVSCVALKLSGIDQIYTSRCSDQILIQSGKHLILFELGLGQEIWRTAHKREISQAAYSRDGSCIGFVDNSNSIFLLEVLTGVVQRQFPTEENDLFLLAISDDGGKAAVANSWTLLLWSIIAGKVLQVFPLSKLISNICFFHSLPIEDQQSRLVCAFRDGSIILYSEAEPCCKLKAKNPKMKIQNVRCLSVSCDNQLLLACTKDCSVQIWDLKTRERLFGQKYPSMKAKQMLLSPCMQWAALCSSDNLIRLWSLTHSPKSEKYTTLKLSAKQNLPLSLASFSSETCAYSDNNFLRLICTQRGYIATLFCGAQFNDSSTFITSRGLIMRLPNIERADFEHKDIL